MKTICFITSSLQGGGAQRVLVNIANQFSQHGWKTHIICFVAKNIPPLYKPHHQIILHFLPRGYTIKDRIIRKCSKMLTAVIKEISPDVIVPFLMPITAYAFIAAQKLNIKIIVSERNDPVRTPVDPYWRKQRDYIFRHADACVFQTEAALDYFGKNKIKKYDIIKNPVNLFGIDERVIVAKERKHNIVCIAKYEPQKNLDFLLEVFAEFIETHSDYELNIYGNDYHHRKRTLIQKAIALNIEDKVHFNEACDNIYEVICDARISVLPSLYEGMPNALIESVSLGIPSIASDCPAYGGRQIIKNGENGFLVEVNNKKEFLEKMVLLADDDSIADKFSSAGKQTKNNFSIDSVYNSWETLVNSTINNKEKNKKERKQWYVC